MSSTLPSDWGHVRLGQQIEIVYGKGLPEHERVSQGLVPVYGSNGIVGQHIEAITNAPVLIIGRKGSAGAVHFSEVPCWPIDTAFYVDKFPPNLDAKYLGFFLQTQNLASLNIHSAIPGIRRDDLYGIVLPIPYPDDPAASLATQRRIVARIEALFAELREARRLHAEIVADTGRMMASVLRASFTGLSSNAPPVRLGDRAIAEILPGQHVMAADYSSAPPGTPYITGPADFGASFPVVSKWTEKPTVMSKPGDVLFTVKGSGVGKVNVAFPDEPVCIGRQIMAIRPNQNRLLTDFLFFALLGRFDEFQDLRQGAAIPGIRKEHVESIEIPLPSRNLQFQVISYVKAVQGEVVEMQQAQSDDTALLAEMEQSILAQAFRGEL